MDSFCFSMSDVLPEPTVLVGLIALTDLIVQKKPVTECTKDTVKTIMGFVILGAGADLAVPLLDDFVGIFRHVFDIQGVVPSSEAIVSVAQKSFEKEAAMIVFFAMVINIMIARFAPWKSILLTGRHTLFMSMMVTVIPATAGMTGTTLIAVSSLVVDMAMVFFLAITHLYMKKVIDFGDVAISHFLTLPHVLVGSIGNKFGNKEHSTEDMNVPKSLLFLRDMPVVISFIISIVLLVTYLLAGVDAVKELSDGKNWFIFSTMQSIASVVGVYIILQGVRMVITEIVPAFRGISDKLVPNTRPALDCSVAFPYAPNAALIGLLSSFAAGLIGMFTLYLLNVTVIIPGVVPHFFVGAATGVFGSTAGGHRGATLGVFAQDLLVTFLPVFLLPVLGDTGFANTAFSDVDFGVLGTSLEIIVR